MKRWNVLMCLLVFSGCGNSKPEAAAEVPGVSPGAPEALRGARLVFERPDGVYLRAVPGEAERLIEGGTWPRWSPDGRFIAFLRDGAVHRYILDEARVEELAPVGDPQAVAVPPGGGEVWFTDGNTVKAVAVEGKAVRTVVEGARVLELDAGPEGRTLVATVKHFGYKVMVFDLAAGSSRTLDKGCSASFSPDGSRVTNNVDGHTRLALLHPETGKEMKSLPAPSAMKTDNQFWSNHPDWIVSMEEVHGHILAHRVSDGAVWRLTELTGCDRPDLFVP